MSLTRRTVWVLALAALSALRLSWQTTGWVMLAIVAMGATDAWLVRRIPAVERTVAPILSRGVASPFDARVRGRWPRIRLRQPSVPDLRIEVQEADRRLSTTVTAVRRGSHVLGPVATRAVGPLGLGCWYHRTGGDLHVTVYPDMPAARRIATSVRLGHFREEGRRTRGPLGLGTEFESIRDYRPDDDIRQINWRATARLAKPMSNQYRLEQDRDVICLLDCGRLMAAGLGDRSRLDAAVDAVAAVAAVADQVGDRVGVVAFDRTVLRRVDPRRDGASPVVAAIHDLEPSEQDSDFDLAFRTVLRHKRAFVLVLTDIVDLAAARPLTEGIPLLARRHAVAVASVTDPDLDEITARPPADRAAMMRMATSIRLIEAKEKVAAAIGHRGAEVVEAPVESFSARCVGAYLRAKRSARL